MMDLHEDIVGWFHLILVILITGALYMFFFPNPHYDEPYLRRPRPVESEWVTPVASKPQNTDPFQSTRLNMVDRQIYRRGVIDKPTLRAMRTVKRHEFVPTVFLDMAYGDSALPIGFGQTISQPYIVAYMTERLGLKPTDKVLEVGTGSGYQAAVLGEIVGKVYTIELVPELAKQAKARLADLGYASVTVKEGDGYFGWKKHAPYDAIIVTCAAGSIPKPLIDQLADGGRMIIPVGNIFQTQWLVFLTKTDGQVTTERLIPVQFVPLVRKK